MQRGRLLLNGRGMTNRVNTRSELMWLYYLCRYLQRKGEGSAVTVWGLNALFLAVLFWAVMYLLLLAILAFNYQKKKKKG